MKKDGETARKQRYRPDRDGTHRRQFEINRKKIFAMHDVCAICGQPVDFSLKYPDPMSPTVDHIIPLSKGGHPSALSNLQLAHFRCNRLKSDKVEMDVHNEKKKREVTMDDLPLSLDWFSYRPGK